MDKSTGLVLCERAYINTTPPSAFEDTSRYGNDGVHTNLDYTKLISGLYVNNFDATGEVITVSDAESIADIWNGGGTAMAWIKPTTAGENSTGAPFYKGWEVWCDDSAASGTGVKIRMNVPWAGNDGEWRTDSNVITLNTWVFLVITYDGDLATNNPIIYIDAVAISAITELTTPTGAAITTDVGTDLLIGDVSASNRAFNGDIGLVKQYNRALSPAEIRRIYNAEKAWFI